jgi:hypothetical protein
MAGPLPHIPPPTQREVEADDARFRRSNLGGDDLATKIVFAVIALGVIAWLARFWFMGHTHAFVNHL